MTEASGAAGAAKEARAGSNGVADEATGELAEHGRLFVRNLAFDVQEEELETLFAEHGAIAELHVPMDADTRRGKGFAYVRYESGEDAVIALSLLDGVIFQGRLLHVMPARALPQAAGSESNRVAGAGIDGEQGALLSRRPRGWK